MTLTPSRMGQAGHALEVAVRDLFDYNGFKTRINAVGRTGESDVIVESGNYVALIECKEFNASSTAHVTRDMISGVAQRAAQMPANNAILATTKPPSRELYEWAANVGVLIVTYDELEGMRQRLRNMPAEAKLVFLVNSFKLIDNPDDDNVRRRRMFVDQLVHGRITKAAVKRSALEALLAIKWYLLGFAIGLVIVAILGVYYVPGFAENLKTFGLLMIVGPAFYIFWRYQNKPKARATRRRGR